MNPRRQNAGARSSVRLSSRLALCVRRRGEQTAPATAAVLASPQHRGACTARVLRLGSLPRWREHRMRRRRHTRHSGSLSLSLGCTAAADVIPQIWITNISQKNPTYLNFDPMETGKPVCLVHGDVFGIGGRCFRLDYRECGPGRRARH